MRIEAAVPRLMATRVGVVVFPGTNCEHDVVAALDLVGADARLLWHGDTEPGRRRRGGGPGGLRPRRLPPPGRDRPVLAGDGGGGGLRRAGGPVVGICNGFQVLTEAGLLPGALQKNRGLRFMCADRGRHGRVRSLGAHHRGVGRDRARAARSTTSTAATSATAGDARRAAGRGAGGVALRRQPQRIDRRHRRDLQRRAATWSASCRTPSGPAPSSSARPTAWCCCGRSRGRRGLSPAPGSAPGAGDAGLLEDRRRHPGRAPGPVADALAVAVGPGRPSRTASRARRGPRSRRSCPVRRSGPSSAG